MRVEQAKPLPPISGRGAPTNLRPTRTGSLAREADGDWLDLALDIDGAPPPLRTTVTAEHPRTIIARNTSPDIGFDRSINPYRGCEHGCVYCYARPTHAFHDLSPGLDFESRLFAKPDAAKLLRAELAKKNYDPAPLAIGTNTDGYQPIEREWGVTRSVIEVLAETRHPLLITTKSDRLLRDLDLLADMARDNLVGVAISVTTLDPKIARTLEPRAPHPRRRLAAIRALVDAGIPTQVNISPIIPAITDHEIEAIVAAAASAGAIRASYILLRLPHEVAPLFRAWLDAHYPDRADKVMHMVQDIRGGRDNDPDFFSRMKGRGVWAQLIRTRVKRAAREHGLDKSFPPIRSDLFRPPERDGQMELF
ncbi:PA0069 family radical SAM protein [Sphingopyxis sp. DHUNG17]|uniref:PA0069 family radical SAM protein n=1 Tax=Sphingopyxis jiangsuensis TaxID=2871171 RepID=UPI0019201CBC|nr:PA0069 family radical SAM protein [Sphingopyxis lutea]MBL0767699.1 PA0069 family radical SAM protein [Sphingopyxis lutea]